MWPASIKNMYGVARKVKRVAHSCLKPNNNIFNDYIMRLQLNCEAIIF